MRLHRALAWLLAACSSNQPASVAPPEPPAPVPAPARPGPDSERARIERLVAQLRETDAAGIGFSPSVTGSQFLPIAAADEQGMLLLGQPPPERSPVLKRLVEAGAAAVPVLLDCLADATQTRVPPMTAMMWSKTSDEYDFNRRTTKRPPGVNRDVPPEDPVEHVVTVGDLCFVALGQIVNRRFAAVRYQPTGGLVVSSPPRSAPLREAARAEWAGLTAARLEASLARDFTEPDREHRRTGALQRLRYYVPAAAAPLLAAELARPVYDGDEVEAHVHRLYALPSARRAREFRGFVAARGEVARDGVLRLLFEDLSRQEAYGEQRVSPPTSGSDVRARECLIELFGYPATVRSTDRPYPQFSSKAERERLLEAARP